MGLTTIAAPWLKRDRSMFHTSCTHFHGCNSRIRDATSCAASHKAKIDHLIWGKNTLTGL